MRHASDAMKILDILTAPWAIQPEKLVEIHAIYAAHARGERADLAAIEARLGRPLDNERQNYEVVNGVAVILIHGVIGKRMNMFGRISGGVSSELVGRDIRDAAADPSVKSILLHIDSPGGTVDGTQTLMNIVREARAAKPVIALADGMMASAAYWIGSAAECVYIADELTQTGSIGVVATHRDISAAEKMAGIKTTEIYAGKYKRIASSHEPLTKAGRQTIQEMVDYTYSIFVGDVAANRGVSVDAVLSDMADGRIFIGRQGIDAGLVDDVSTLEALTAGDNNTAPAQVAGRHRGESTMKITMETLLAEAPALAEALRAEGRELALAEQEKLIDAARAEGREAGATAERERIQAVEAQLIPGHEALINTLKFDGRTSGPEAAVKVLAAEREQRERMADDRRADAPDPVPFAPDAEDKPAPASVEDAAKAEWDADADLRAEFGDNFETYLAWKKADAAGRVKIHGEKS